MFGRKIPTLKCPLCDMMVNTINYMYESKRSTWSSSYAFLSLKITTYFAVLTIFLEYLLLNYLVLNILKFSTYHFFTAYNSLARSSDEELEHSDQSGDTIICELVAQKLIHITAYIRLHYYFTCGL